MTCIFALRSVTDKTLLPQLAAALERHPELAEREQVPPVWRAPERIAVSASQAPDARTRRRRLRYKTLGVMMLILGVLLIVPELFARERSGSLLVGAIAFAWGVFTLAERDRKVQERERPETPPERLLCDLGGMGRDGAHAIFGEDELALETPDGERVAFPYGGVEYALETRDLLLLTGEARVVTLQKSEMSWGEWPEFRDFLAEKVEIIQCV